MKVLEINSVPYGSPCRIMLGIKQAAEKSGVCIDTSTGYSYHPIKELPNEHIQIGSAVGKVLHTICSRITGYNGCFSHFATWRLLRRIKKENYDLIHFHNIHGWYLNLPMLTRYIKKHEIKVIWTLHDCWPFTGQCAYYSRANCDRWKDHCHSCPQCRSYPETFVDRSFQMYELKRNWFIGMDAILVTPSKWLADQVKQSFLKCYPVKVIHNGIDLSVFKHKESDFRQKYNCVDKKIVLGVSLEWGIRKGLDVFIELATRLSNDHQIVLVGGNEQIDQQLPRNVISIHRTQNQQELAEIYSAADVFVNPTREDNFPTVNIEALACGTPVITFRTGGSPEIIDETCGSVVECDDVDALEESIHSVCEKRQFSEEACVARAKSFENNVKFQEYVELYNELLRR